MINVKGLFTKILVKQLINIIEKKNSVIHVNKEYSYS